MNLLELKENIILIRDATKSGENTASRVGGTLLDILNYSISRGQGTSEDSDPFKDSHKWLGSVGDDDGLNTLLDGLHGKGGLFPWGLRG